MKRVLSRRFLRTTLLVSIAVLLTAVAVLWPYSGRSLLAQTGLASTQGRAAAARERVLPNLRTQLAGFGMQPGDPVFVRIFKQEAMLELWMASAGENYQRVLQYPICRYSGVLGPKTRQGDQQAPEGFYTVRRGQLNPASSYHLSFNLGYPNAYERAQGWTGDYLMVHGNCVSIGCYAMGDDAIEQIYTLIDAALAGGQSAVPVHVFPFHLDAAHEDQRQSSIHADFWAQLAVGYRAFETTRKPPVMQVHAGRYVLKSD